MRSPHCLALLTLTVLTLASPALHAQAPRMGGAPQERPAPSTPAVTVPLSTAEAQTLTFMRQEEKLARDLYRTFFAIWQHAIFDNIANSEQRHMDIMGVMLELHGLPDPLTTDATGSFADPALADLFGQLAAQGGISLLDALWAGALVEEVDIRDLQQAIAGTGQAALLQAYGNLLHGSYNHLRAFAGQIEALGGAYTAQVLDSALVETILASPMDNGR